MEEYHIPGLAFVMVKDGEIFLSKGYGYADVTEKTANSLIELEPGLFQFPQSNTKISLYYFLY